MDREPIPIAPILEAYGWDGSVRGHGTWKAIRCPFHPDRNQSASVSLTGFKCHACQRKGNAVTLVASVEGVTPSKARELIRNRGFKPLSSNQPAVPNWLRNSSPASKSTKTQISTGHQLSLTMRV